jgi:TetR/AcrR family transcriptional regulator, transcriptional repressor for nem operon
MDMRDALINNATQLVRRSGYAGFSYSHLSDAVGIRKASIHYHFPNKEDLGLGIVEAYREFIRGELEEISAREQSAKNRLSAYADLYRKSLKDGNGCLCGVLAAEFDNLPSPVQAAVTLFFEENVAWLEGVLAAGRRDGSVRRDIPATKLAGMLLAMLQGAMTTARARKQSVVFDDAVAASFAAIKA